MSAVLTADIRSKRHLTVVDHGLTTRSSEASTKAAAVHLGAAEAPLAERLEVEQKTSRSHIRAGSLTLLMRRFNVTVVKKSFGHL